MLVEPRLLVINLHLLHSIPVSEERQSGSLSKRGTSVSQWQRSEASISYERRWSNYGMNTRLGRLTLLMGSM